LTAASEKLHKPISHTTGTSSSSIPDGGYDRESKTPEAFNHASEKLRAPIIHQTVTSFSSLPDGALR
ncbi:hypothetical protein CHS0354_006191, partial [Potamilus streckersoni]